MSGPEDMYIGSSVMLISRERGCVVQTGQNGILYCIILCASASSRELCTPVRAKWKIT